MMTELHLLGCAPTPLAHYLKALGILRLVAEQADPGARGGWQAEHFVLQSRLDHEALLRFFLDDYVPTPIISPWLGRAGFLEGEDADESSRKGAELMRLFGAIGAARFRAIREVVEAVRDLPVIHSLNASRAEAKSLAHKKKDQLTEADRSRLACLKKSMRG